MIEVVPRGIRNNNPGNIRRGNTIWSGQSPLQTDPDFTQFIAPEYGIRAMVKILRSYARVGINTIQNAIDRWAPPNENLTDPYVSAVCVECGVGPDDIVDLEAIMSLLLRGIIRHENGLQPYSDPVIARGIALA